MRPAGVLTLLAFCVSVGTSETLEDEDPAQDIPAEPRLGDALNHVASVGSLVPNHNPLYERGPEVYVFEDSGVYNFPWATDIVDGDGPIVNGRATLQIPSLRQSLNFRLIVGRPTLFAPDGQPQMADDGFLTFRPAADECGVSSVNVQLRDDGTPTCIPGTDIQGNVFVCPGACFPVDCHVSVQTIFFIEVVCVNDPPTFTSLGDQVSVQDAGLITVPNWATGVSPGVNEPSQTISWLVTNTNNGLFTTQPRIQYNPANPTVADLVYQSAPGVCGTATVTVRAQDNNGTAATGSIDLSVAQTFTITVTCVNSNPTFICNTIPVRVIEDQGVVTIPNWATGIDDGDPNQVQAVSFAVTLVDINQADLFIAQPTLDGDGTLAFQAKPDANTFNGAVDFYVVLRDSLGATSCNLNVNAAGCCKGRIIITPVNDPPSFLCGRDVIVCEDLRDLPVAPTPPIYTDGNGWATEISVGAENEGFGQGFEGQTVTFRLVADNPQIFAKGPAIDKSGTLTFELKEHANGKTGVKVFMTDDGSNAAPSSNVAASCEFIIDVTPVDDAPFFAFGGGDITLAKEDAPLVDTTFVNWIIDINKGPIDEDDQVLTFFVTHTNKEMFKTPPVITMDTASSARLVFELNPDMCGQSDLVVELRDTGSIAQCKAENSFKLPHTLKVDCVNDPPTFNFSCEGTANGCNIRICEDDEPYSSTNFIRNALAGPPVFDEQQQIVSFSVSTDNDRLFDELPALSGHGTLTFKTKKDVSGSVTVTVTAIDSGIEPQTSFKTFGITIVPGNDPPDFKIRGNILGQQIPECTADWAPECQIPDVLPAACSRTFPNWIYDVTTSTPSKVISGNLPDPSNEDLQKVSFQVIVDEVVLRELFVVPPRIDVTTGTLTFTTKLGVSTVTPITFIIVANDSQADNSTCGGRGIVSKSMTIEIAPVNWPPCFVCGGSVEVLEDRGQKIVLNHAMNITAGPFAEKVQNMKFTLIPSSPEMFLEGPNIDASTGNLRFTPKADFCGTSDVTVALDDGESTNSAALQCNFQIVVNKVNDPPTFSHGSKISIDEDSGYYCQTWIHDSSAGPLESSPHGQCDQQRTRFTVTIIEDNNDIFLQVPEIDALSGNLCFKSKAEYCGVATITVQMFDDGGMDNGGNDRSLPTTSEIEVTCINDAPSFTPGVDLTVCEDRGPVVEWPWCSRMTPGPTINENIQALQFNIANDNKALFLVEPYIDANTCNIFFTPNKDAYGVARLTIDLCDNGPTTTPHVNCAKQVTRSITVLPVNDPPHFLHSGDITVIEDKAQTTYPKWARDIVKGGLLENPIGAEDFQSLQFILTMSQEDEALFSQLPQVDTRGDLSFGLAPDMFGRAVVTICLKDDGGVGPLPSSAGPVICPIGTPLPEDTFCDQFNINIIACNDPPSFEGGNIVTVFEDMGVTTVNSWIRNLQVGPPNERTTQRFLSAVVTTPTDKQFMFTELPSLVENGATFDLTFRTADNINGMVLISVVFRDDAGTDGEGCNDVLEHVFSINIRDRNDAPQFLGIDEVVVDEDSPSYEEQWATGITAGPHETQQVPIFILEAVDPRLFSQQPAVSPAGVLTFTPQTNAFGETLVTAVLNDGGGDNSVSPPFDFKIVIRPVNDPPIFTKGQDLIVTEGAAPLCERGWASKISGGPNEENQRVTFAVTPLCCTNYFGVVPFINEEGDLCFTLAEASSGEVLVSVVARDNGVNSFNGVGESQPQTFRINIVPVNNAPYFDEPGVIDVLEDAPQQTFPKFITGMHAGQNEDDQSINFQTVPREPEFFVNGVSIDISGDVSFQLNPNIFGTTTVDVTLFDDGALGNGGINSFSRALSIRVSPVNDAPSFIGGPDLMDVYEDASKVVIRRWATVLIPGPSNENGQTLSFEVTTVNPALFIVSPQVTVPEGDLFFTLYPDAAGETNVIVRLRDSGGIDHGGVDASPPHAFTIKVIAVNDPPSYIAGPPIVTVVRNSGQYRAQWATGVVPGPPNEIEEGQFVNFTVQPALPELFAVQPTIDSNGVLSFIPAEGYEGNTTAVVLVRDSLNREGTAQQILFVVTTENPNVIRVISAQEYSLFSAALFANIVSESMPVPKERVMVVGLQPGSVIVDFFFSKKVAGTDQETSKGLTDSFLAKMRDPDIDRSALKQKLNIMEVYPLSNDTTVYRPTTDYDNDDGMKDAYIAVIVVVVLVITAGLVVLGVFLIRKRRRAQIKRERHQDASVDQLHLSGNIDVIAHDGGHPNAAQKFSGAPTSFPTTDNEIFGNPAPSEESRSTRITDGSSAYSQQPFIRNLVNPSHIEHMDNPIQEVFSAVRLQHSRPESVATIMVDDDDDGDDAQSIVMYGEDSVNVDADIVVGREMDEVRFDPHLANFQYQGDMQQYTVPQNQPEVHRSEHRYNDYREGYDSDGSIQIVPTGEPHRGMSANVREASLG